MKKILKFTIGSVLITALLLLNGAVLKISAQLPSAMVKEMDALNAAFYNALKIIDIRSETEALQELSVIKPKIKAQAGAFMNKWEGVAKLTEEEETDFGRKQLEKQLYKDLMALLSKPSFTEKVENSEALKKEYQLLMSYMDIEKTKETTEETDLSDNSLVCSFTIEGKVPYSGQYRINASDEQAFAYIDENNLFAVEVNAALNKGEFILAILAEEPKAGEHKWSMESQIIIQSWDENQNEVIQLSNYYKDGSITFDKIEGVGGMVSGSFSGKFFDDTQSTEDPVQVHGKFLVKRISGSN